MFSAGLALPGATSNRLAPINRPGAVVGDVAVVPGDWVVGDGDGVAVVPGDVLDQVLAVGRSRADKETGYFAGRSSWRRHHAGTAGARRGLTDGAATSTAA